ncbi:MAG TPA: hypothetical protein V6C46_08670 [Coleofasciculaceae cyanobacterium]
MVQSGIWLWSEEHQQLCQVIETQSLWGNQFCRVWLPTQDEIVRIPAEKLRPLDESALSNPAKLVYIALLQVREYRLELLRQEEQARHEQLRQTAQSTPELVPLLLVHIGDG